MNDHTHTPNSEYPDGDGGHEALFAGDDFDPVIAKRFGVLDRVATPDPMAMPVAMPAAASSSGPGQGGEGRRSGFLVAVAACVGVLVMGVAGLVALDQRGTTDLVEEAAETGDVPVVVDGSDPADSVDAPDTTSALVVEGAAGGSTTRPEPASDNAAGGNAGSDGGDGTESDGAANGAANGNSDDKSGADTGSTGSESNDGSTTSTTTPNNAESTVPFSTDTTDLFVTTLNKNKQPTETIWPQDPGAESGDVVSLRGMVTEVFTDCMSRLVLDENGKVVEQGPVSCDGGSYIIVNGTKVFTSSGYTSADQAYNKHPQNLKPGQPVSVTAAELAGAGGLLGLGCDQCRVTVG